MSGAAEQFASHSTTLAPFRPGSTPLGAIVIPATRQASGLLPSIRLAAELGVPLVVLCSGQTRPRDVVRLADGVAGAQCWAIDMASLRWCSTLPQINLPVFATDEYLEAIFGSYGDLSLKRNLGVLIGRLAGWRSLLFLDDDISGLTAAKVRRAVGGLDHASIVGMPATDFPDNSVVCHARRDFGERGDKQQDVFVSGSAIAVRLDVDTFFPSIYNEDWLFLAPYIARGAVTRSGTVLQEPYYPFDSKGRAERQEFGDVLAEGLVGYLHQGESGLRPSRAYWRSFLNARKEVIAGASAGAARQVREHVPARDARKVLWTSEISRRRITPELLDQYVVTWQRDLVVWRKYLDPHKSLHSLENALHRLRLSGNAIHTTEVGAPVG